MPSQILVIDDDVAVAQGIATLLGQAGYGVQHAHTAAQAQPMLAQHPDLIVLDLVLPDMNGFSLCRSIRQLQPYIPILMLTACDTMNDKVLGLDLGADEYMTKPFDPRELVARLNAMLRLAKQCATRIEPQVDQPLIYELIKVWRSQRKVEVDGQYVDLTPKEWLLLETLLERPGHVVGRETLLERVWGWDFGGETRVVDVHVQRLRAKLEAAASTVRCIETVRGFGYRFTPQPIPRS